MNFLPKDLRYQDTDMHGSYDHLAKRSKRIADALDNMAKSRDVAVERFSHRPKTDEDFGLPPQRNSVTNKQPEVSANSFFDSILTKFGCIKS